MNAQVSFKDGAAIGYGRKTFARRRGAAIVPTQIGQHLFAFKNCGYPGLTSARAVCGHIRAVAALRKTHLDSAGRVALRLCPENGEALETSVRVSFAAPRL
ncbi:MAG: hypothetical protein M3Q89_08850 [Verrucomicrobiota bacterium]|nr:hypothetical protein [Verrucomicrobiota bacterium]